MPRAERTLFEPAPPVWKAKAIIIRLGGVGGLTDKLMERGFHPPPAFTIQGWLNRNSIPGSWAPAVFMIAMQEGIIKSPMDALITDFSHERL